MIITKKIENQHQAIIVLLLEGWTNAMQALEVAGSIKLATRVSELSKDFTIEKRKVDSMSRFGHTYYYFEYRIVQDNRTEDGIKKYWPSKAD